MQDDRHKICDRLGSGVEKCWELLLLKWFFWNLSDEASNESEPPLQTQIPVPS